MPAGIDKKKLYDLILEGLPVGLFLVDKELRIVDFNPAAERITGRTREEVLGRPCAEILENDLCGEDSPLREEIGGPEEYIERESTIMTGLGQEVAVHFTAASFFEEDGGYAGGVGIFSDASSTKRVEVERKNLISMFTHDLKSPVAVVGGIIVRLLEKKPGDLNEKQHQYLTLAKKEVVKLESYIHGFLDALRFEAGQIPLYYTPCSLERSLHDLVEACQFQAAEKNITMSLEIPAPLPVVNIDRNQLERAIANVIDNAVKYSPEGTLIVIRATEEEYEIVVEVRDQGPGIAPEDLPHIFDYFYRCRNRPKKVAGTGLGLSIVKGIIESHGGHIWVQSRLQEGTSFFLTVPKEKQVP